jgi:MutS domain V
MCAGEDATKGQPGAAASALLHPSILIIETSRYVLEDATADSLVLVDELGKGTEVRAGAAIAAAVLEALDAAGCKVCVSPRIKLL